MNLYYNNLFVFDIETREYIKKTGNKKNIIILFNSLKTNDKNLITTFKQLTRELNRRRFDLSSLHTKQLMNLRSSFYKLNYLELKNKIITRQMFFNELDKREHIPNKQETKQIRKSKIKG
jgi:hypothetical protein